MKQLRKKILSAILCLTMVVSLLPQSVVYASETAQEYQIYPTPHTMTYQDGDYILRENVNVIYDTGIDDVTKGRLEEAMALKGLIVSESTAAVNGATNIYVGINGSGGPAETYIEANYTVDASLFDNTDSYFLASDDNTIVVLGKDTDASYYGLTSLYHVVAQMDSLTIRNFTIEDYADVVSRGFIEGYYGNPWATEDRCNLMEWGGYYKLNSYFYAPKDDPKHNSNWRELYTTEEIESKIKPLADAGNASKCRFVYALHPYMYNAIDYTSTETYEADLAVMQAKFAQVIEAGVRQIAILADDASNVGSDNYIKTLEDMTEWLTEMQAEYPDLKLTLPFCTQEYMYNGESYYANFPENVQIVMTGGKVWGEVTDDFTTTFTNTVGRGPYMWINWPCTDNSKKHLIMGGYTTFLHSGVDPSKIQGIVLNPMQQSEPSKVAIFGNACYSWNIWETDEEADAAWEASFSYVDHNSAIPNAASNALRELSKHMINQNMDSRVTALQESVELKEKLNTFKDKLEDDTVTAADADEMIAEFEILQKAAKTYRASAGDTNIRDQIVYWLNCWDDTTEAAIAYLNGVKAAVAGDSASVLDYNVVGKTAFDSSKTHGFHYVDHTEYAEVGVQHIVPFINTVAAYVSEKAELAIDPDKLITTYITNRSDSPATGSVDNIMDGDVTTSAIYKTPNTIAAGDYVGVKYSKVIDINDIRFVLGAGKDHFDEGKLQYTMDGTTWEDITLTGMTNSFTGTQNVVQDISVTEENLPENFQAMGIRFIATADNENDAWLEVREITINASETEIVEYTTTVTLDQISLQGGTLSNITDDSTSTYAHLAEDPYKGGTIQDYIPVDGTVTLTFSNAIRLGSIVFQQDSGTDKLSSYALEYTTDGTTWVTLQEYAGDAEVNLTLSDQNITATAVRVRNLEENLSSDTAGYWWKLYNFNVTQYSEDSESEEDLELTMSPFDSGTGVYSGSLSNVVDGDTSTSIWYSAVGTVGQYIGVDLGTTVKLGQIDFVMDSGDCWSNYELQYSTDGTTYTTYDTYTSSTLNVDLTTEEIEARYVRFYNTTATSVWTKIYEISVGAQKERRDLIYTNLAGSSAYTASVDEGTVTLAGPNSVTLAAGEYIGVDLKNIKGITDIQVTDSSVQLQTSMNTIIWTDVTGSTYGDARYVRLVNNGDAAQTITFDGMTVSFEAIQEKSVTSTLSQGDATRDMRSLGNVENVFDGDLSTYGEITGAQTANGEIVFDMGQEISFESLRYYIVETNKDYLRYAAFEVANDPEATTWERILVVGESGFENTANDLTAKDASYLTHDSSNPGYMYAEATGLNVTGRYLRVVPLETYSHRWVQFNELQINGGAYFTTESNRDILADAIEEDYKIPSNALDGDYATTYKPSAADSSFTYRISVGEQRTIRIIQNGAASNAVLTAKVYKDGAEEEIALGNLNQTINEFAVPADMQLLEVTAVWEDVIPEISIIKTTSEAAEDTVDKSALIAEMNLKDDAEIATWTQESQEAYASAYEVAETVNNNSYTTQNAVDLTTGALESARVNAVVKGDVDALQAALDSKEVNEVDGVQIYSSTTYAAYADVISEIEAALEDADNVSQDETDELLAELETAEGALQYSLIQRELAEVTLENDEGAYVEEDYNASSYAAYVAAKEALETAIAEDKAERKNPTEIAALRTAYAEAVAGLSDEEEPVAVDKSALATKIAEAEGLTEAEYTAETWAALETEIAEATAVNTNEAATQEEVDAALAELQAAMDALEDAAEETPDPSTDVTEIFSDVVTGTWYVPYVQYVYENNIMTGSEGVFLPTEAVTRAMVAETLYKLEGRPAVTDYTEYDQLTDLSRDNWWASSVAWALNTDVATGDTYNMVFNPETAVTREQLATFLYRYANYKGLDTTQTGDLSGMLNADQVNSFAQEAVTWAVGAGLISGIQSTDANGDVIYDLAPQAGASRAELAAVLQRFCEGYGI